jgi:hypothetical protein
MNLRSPGRVLSCQTTCCSRAHLAEAIAAFARPLPVPLGYIGRHVDQDGPRRNINNGFTVADSCHKGILRNRFGKLASPSRALVVNCRPKIFGSLFELCSQSEREALSQLAGRHSWTGLDNVGQRSPSSQTPIAIEDWTGWTDWTPLHLLRSEG